MTLRFTQQAIDPVTAVAARPLAIAGAVLSPLLALALTLAHLSEVRFASAAALGVLLVTAAGGVAIVGTSPSRAPFTTERLGLMSLLAVAGAIAEYISTVGQNRFLYDDYGATVTGLLILSISPYCTWLALAVAGGVSSTVLVILVVGAAPFAWGPTPLPSLIAAAIAILLAMTAAASAYSWTAVADLLAVQREANRAALVRDAELRRGMANARRLAPVSMLAREVLPFLARVMTADRITVGDADRARELAESLRQALRAGFESTWLDELAADIAASQGVDVAVEDPASDVRRLTDDQRALVAGFLIWSSEAGRASAAHVSVTRSDAPAAGVMRGVARAAARRGEREAAPPPVFGRITITIVPGASEPDLVLIERFTPLARTVGLAATVSTVGENIRVELRYDLD